MSHHSFDPVHVLGTTPEAAARLLEGRRVTPGEVEALASIYYDWREHLRDPHSYWVTVGQAACLNPLRGPTCLIRRPPHDGAQELPSGFVPVGYQPIR